MTCPDCEREMPKGSTSCDGCGWRASLLERIAAARLEEDQQREERRRELEQDPQWKAKQRRQAKADYQELEATRKRLGMSSRPPAPASAWGYDEIEAGEQRQTNEDHHMRLETLKAKHSGRTV